jgi:N-acyl-phosphatidylethanolamine-hydrolysing phospholipase D
MEDTRPPHHANSPASSFKNPWVQPKSLLESGQGLLNNNFPLAFAKRLHDHPALPVEVIKPDWGKDEPDQGRVKATWLGHAVSQNKHGQTLV